MIALLVLASQASATTYLVKFCFTYDVAYADADSSFGDDYVTTDTTYPARGARAKVTENITSTVKWDDFVEDDTPDPGCTDTLTLDSTRSYDIKVKSYAQVNGNTMWVYTDDTLASIYATGPGTYAPTASGTVNISTPGGTEQWNIANAIGHAMWRRDGGMTGETFNFANEAGPNGTEYIRGDAGDPDDDFVYVSSGGNDNKYMIVHEFGHLVAAQANDGGPPDNDDGGVSYYDADEEECFSLGIDEESHSMNSKEYQGAASWEGIAHYYAAVAFNDTTESDCVFVCYKDTDWDLDELYESSQEEAEFAVSCEDGPTVAPDDAYMNSYCSGTFANRSTEYDWLRFFWDLDTDQALTYSTVLSIWDAADPDDWTFTGIVAHNHDDLYPCNPTPTYPMDRLRCGANLLGKLTQWDAEDAENGVEH